MSKITNDGLTWSGTGCFIAVPSTHVTTLGVKGLNWHIVVNWLQCSTLCYKQCLLVHRDWCLIVRKRTMFVWTLYVRRSRWHQRQRSLRWASSLDVFMVSLSCWLTSHTLYRKVLALLTSSCRRLFVNCYLSVCLSSVCHMTAPNSCTEMLRIVLKVVCVVCHWRTSFDVRRWRSQGYHKICVIKPYL